MSEPWLLICSAQADHGAMALHRLDRESTDDILSDAVPHPSFLAQSMQRGSVYVASERPHGDGQVTLVSITGAALSAGTGFDSGGQGAVHLCLDREERFLFVANYQAVRKAGDVSLSVFPLQEDGRLLPAASSATHLGHGPDARRQEAAHCHSVMISPDNRLLAAADLGTDSLFVYRFDGGSGAIVLLQNVAMPAGSGPRHSAFHPNGGALYVTGELDSTLITLRVETENLSVMTRQPSTRATAASRNYPSGVTVTPDGHYVLVANRGADSIAVFWIDPQTLTPSFKAEVSCGGRFPRALRFDRAARRLAVANQKSDTVAIFDWDYEQGMLGRKPAKTIAVAAPLDMLFLDDQ